MIGFAKQLAIGLLLLIWMTIITGIIYPAIITGCAQFFFPWKANGSLIIRNGKLIGSELIGQSFTEDKYFWGRPSATTPYPYNAENSSGSNYGPMNADFLNQVKNQEIFLENSDKQNHQPVPVDLVTSSGSGLDPEISPYAALYQAYRVAKARHLAEDNIEKLLRSLIRPRTFTVLGEPRINVLELNLALDDLDKSTPKYKGG